MSIPEFTAKPVEEVRLLPIYVLCDSSGSMAHEKAIDAVNEGLDGILREIRSQGAKGKNIRLCLISFATHASVTLPLTKVTMETYAPPLKAEGVTNLPDAIQLLEQTLSDDYHRLRDEGVRAYRPAVFVFTDGRPTDARGQELTDHSIWQARLEELKTHPIWAPRIYAYGFGAAEPAQLKLLVNEKGVADDVVENRVNFTGAEAAESIGRIFPHLFKTLTEAAQVVSGGHATEKDLGDALDNAHARPTTNQNDTDDWWNKVTGAV